MGKYKESTGIAGSEAALFAGAVHLCETILIFMLNAREAKRCFPLLVTPLLAHPCRQLRCPLCALRKTTFQRYLYFTSETSSGHSSAAAMVERQSRRLAKRSRDGGLF